jgi:hypothetical protein
MFGALLIHLAVIAGPATVADVASPNCTTVHCSATVNESAKNQSNENCAGAPCAPTTGTAARSDTRYGGENLEAGHDRAGLDAQNRRYGDAGVDHSFDNAHDANFDREGYDRSGTWPAH